MPENTEAATLKAARAASTTARAKVNTPPPATTVGVDEPARNSFSIGDPDEPRAVVEASGLYGDIVGDDYVVAHEDAEEQVRPHGCIDSVSRLRWAKGQHVPIEVFRKHYGGKEKADKLLADARAKVAAGSAEETAGE